MKPSTLKRLEELEQAANRVTLPPLLLVDVTKFDGSDRDAYWQGDTTVMTRSGVPADSPSGMIHTLVIDLNPECRAKWLTTVDMDDEDLEAFEQRQILDEQRRERDARDQQERARLEAWREAEPRYDHSGYPISTEPF